ncbi:MAG: 50S ribosomal protein L14 [Candidatus Wildermuthbacteria bacterium]|nr:50S ribosomal protein L14 [Candidatus Wildermuthbacteria bacterium]
MIQLRTHVNIADNTGAKVIECFHVMGGGTRRYARIGDIIVGAVKVAEPRRLVKKHEVVRAVVVRQKRAFRRKDGSYIRFDENAAVILEKEKEPKGARMFGPFPREIRDMGFTKIAALAPEII